GPAAAGQPGGGEEPADRVKRRGFARNAHDAHRALQAGNRVVVVRQVARLLVKLPDRVLQRPLRQPAQERAGYKAGSRAEKQDLPYARGISPLPALVASRCLQLPTSLTLVVPPCRTK